MMARRAQARGGDRSEACPAFRLRQAGEGGAVDHAHVDGMAALWLSLVLPSPPNPMSPLLTRRALVMKPIATRFAILAIAWVGMLPAAGAAEPPVQTEVFTSQTEGYHTFRIPALVITKQGTLLAFCEGRKTSRADQGDIDLVLKRSTDGGKTWGPLQVVHEEGGTAKITIGNPCPVVDQDTGTVWLPFCRDNNDVFVTHSTDEGRTWAAPVQITAQVKKPGWTWYATGPGVGIQLRHGPHRGRLVIPCDHREKLDGQLVTHAHAFY